MVSVQPRYKKDPLTFYTTLTLIGGVYMASALTTALLTLDTLIGFRVANTGASLTHIDSTPDTPSTGFGPIIFRSAKAV